VRLAALLLAVIAIVNYGYDPLAQAYENPARAAKSLYYIFRGFEGAILFVLVGLLARSRLVWLVCLWGAFEEGQSGVCQLAIGVLNRRVYEPFQGICGNGWYMGGIVIAAWLALLIHDNNKGK
jgi:hypothetical protein